MNIIDISDPHLSARSAQSAFTVFSLVVGRNVKPPATACGTDV